MGIAVLRVVRQVPTSRRFGGLQDFFLRFLEPATKLCGILQRGSSPSERPAQNLRTTGFLSPVESRHGCHSNTVKGELSQRSQLGPSAMGAKCDRSDTDA